MKKISYYLNNLAKIICIAGIVGSFVFFGWRIAHKKAYMKEQMAQCRAYAASAILVTADVLSENGATAELVKKEGEIKFTADHMRVPGGNGVALIIKFQNDGYVIDCTADTGWNSRAPQSCRMRAELTADGELSYPDKETEKYIESIKSAEYVRDKFAQEQLFSYEFDINCPAPYNAHIARIKADKRIRVFVRE